MKIHNILLSGLAFIGALHLPSVFGQAYPTRPITFIYPYGAGSQADTAFRLAGQEAAKRLGQTIVHENRPGAGGRIGFEATGIGITRYTVWTAVVGPPNLSQNVVAALNKAYQEALLSPEVRSKIEPTGVILKGGRPEELLAAIRAERDLLGPAIRAANIRLQ